jgi:hypothetical protein
MVRLFFLVLEKPGVFKTLYFLDSLVRPLSNLMFLKTPCHQNLANNQVYTVTL